MFINQMLQSLARDRMAAPFQISQELTSSIDDTSETQNSKLQAQSNISHEEQSVPVNSPMLSMEEMALRSEVTKLVSRVLAKAVAEVCTEFLPAEKHSVEKQVSTYMYMYICMLYMWLLHTCTVVLVHIHVNVDQDF